MKLTTLGRALTDKKLLGLGGDSWLTWRSVLKAAHGEALTAAERAAFDLVAGGRAPPKRKVKQLCALVSRRAGKGRAAGALATYASVLTDHASMLAPGEVGVCAVLSPTRPQAQIVQKYCRGYFEASPILRGEIAEVTADEIRLRNGVVICTLASDFRTLRGRTLLLAILDEASFLHGDTAASDIETARALLPGLATTGGMLVTISSPYRRSGLVYELHRDFFGVDSDDVLVVAGPSIAFNPTLDALMIAAAAKADPEAAQSEWLGNFRNDLAQFLPDALIDAAIDHNRPLELPPQPGVAYTAFVDASSGTGHDAYTLAIGHKAADGCCVLDLVRGTDGPFDPGTVTAEYAKLVREFGIGSVTGDHFAAGWVGGSWQDCGVGYQRSEPNKSAIYLEFVSLFTRGTARLSNHATLLRELRALERRTGRGGKDSIDHPPRGSDDFANAVAGCLVLASGAQPSLWSREQFLGTDAKPVPPPKAVAAVFAVLTPGQRGDGAVIYAGLAHGFGQLFLLDLHRGPLSPKLLTDIATRLIDLSGAMHAHKNAIYTTTALAAQFERLGYFAETIDSLLAETDPMLAVSAAIHVNGGRVRCCPEFCAAAETAPLGFLHGVITETDAMQTATLAGIAAALDEGR